MESVFLVHHVHELPDDAGEDVKLIGAYATKEDAEMAVQRLRSQPGFRDHPNGFSIGLYAVGEDHWREGFVTVGSTE